MPRPQKAKLSLKTLMEGTAKLRPNQIRNGLILKKVSITEAKPIIRNKQLLVKAQALGTAKNSIYEPKIMFMRVEYSPVQTSEYSLPVELGSGEVMYMKKISYSKTPVTVTCTCFTGDTLIKMSDGSSVKIKDLTEEPSILVLSYDNKFNKFTSNIGKSSRLTRKDADVVKVTFSNGGTIRCTPDHKFLLSNGKYKEVKDISPEDYLMSMKCVGPHKEKTVIIKSSETNKSLQIESIVDDGKEDVYDLNIENDHNFTIDISNGENEISEGVVVHNCQDFYFTWWYYNNKNSAHFGGKLRPYIRKTVDWPARNPLKVSGMCKHLIKMQDNLLNMGLLTK